MLEYSVKRIDVPFAPSRISFEFSPENEMLSAFMTVDSPRIFGRYYEHFDEIMQNECYAAYGNAYGMEMTAETVTVTYELTDDVPPEKFPREDFTRIMREWIRENEKIRENELIVNEEKLKRLSEEFTEIYNEYKDSLDHLKGWCKGNCTDIRFSRNDESGYFYVSSRLDSSLALPKLSFLPRPGRSYTKYFFNKFNHLIRKAVHTDSCTVECIYLRKYYHTAVLRFSDGILTSARLLKNPLANLELIQSAEDAFFDSSGRIERISGEIYGYEKDLPTKCVYYSCNMNEMSDLNVSKYYFKYDEKENLVSYSDQNGKGGAMPPDTAAIIKDMHWGLNLTGKFRGILPH